MIFELNAEEREKNIKEYEADMRREEGAILEAKYWEGYYDAKADGEQAANVITARKLKKMGSTNEFISEATGLSLKKVRSL